MELFWEENINICNNTQKFVQRKGYCFSYYNNYYFVTIFMVYISDGLLFSKAKENCSQNEWHGIALNEMLRNIQIIELLFFF